MRKFIPLLTVAAFFGLSQAAAAGTPSCNDTGGDICTNYLNLPSGLYQETKSNCSAIGGKWSDSPCQKKGMTCRHAPMEYMGKKVWFDSIYYNTEAFVVQMACQALGGSIVK